MDMENKLDEDYLFYLEFANCFDRLKTEDERERAQIWLQELCGHPCIGTKNKRNRNIFLSNLVLCMQEGELSGPFQHLPNEIDFEDAMKHFGQDPPEVQDLEWLKESDEGEDTEVEPSASDGRTYVATRTLPDGEGAFAYLAVSLADDGPLWLAQSGEGLEESTTLDAEVEKIWLRRKGPEGWQKVFTFYDALLQNICDEIEGKISSNENETVNELVKHLTSDLSRKGEYSPYLLMEPDKLRMEMLTLLYSRLDARRQKIAKRGEFLDKMELQCKGRTLLEDLEPELELTPDLMWQQAINRQPKQANMERLFNTYPNIVIDKFLELLSQEKQEIAARFQNRHESVVSQMKEDLKGDAEKERAEAEKAQYNSDQAIMVLKDVQNAFMNQLEMEKATTEKMQSETTDQKKLYEEIRAALHDTYKGVEEEAERGRCLVDQINATNRQTEMLQLVNEHGLNTTEKGNMKLAKNIKKLRSTIDQFENRTRQIQKMSRGSVQEKASRAFFK